MAKASTYATAVPTLDDYLFGTDDPQGTPATRNFPAQDARDVFALAAINTQTGTTYTLALTDQGDIVEMNNGSANTLTIPTNAAVAFPVGTRIRVTQFGAGTTTVQGDTGVTVNGTSAGSEAISGQFAHLFLYQRAVDDWLAQSGGGGGGTPGGLDTHVQFNDGGSFGGEAAFAYDKTTNNLTVGLITIEPEYNGFTSRISTTQLVLRLDDGGAGVALADDHFGVDSAEVSVASDIPFGWSDGQGARAGTLNLKLWKDAANILAQRDGTNVQTHRLYATHSSGTDYHRSAWATAKVTLSAVSGASVTASSLIPDGAVVLGVTTKVTTALGTGNGTTGYQVGDGSDVDRWGEATTVTLGTVTDNRDWTSGTIECFTAAQDVVLTAVGGNFDGTGAVEVTISYMRGEAD